MSLFQLFYNYFYACLHLFDSNRLFQGLVSQKIRQGAYSVNSVVSLKSSLVIACFFLSSLLSLASIAEQHIYLVRHAEKQSDGTSDPALTETGKRRAMALAEQLANNNISAVYSSNYQRTKQTAAPLAQQLNLEVTLYDPRKLKELAATIKATQGNVLIVGHSNTTPALAFYLGGHAFGDIDESEYDRLYHLQIKNDQVTSSLLRSKPVKQYAALEAVQINNQRFTPAINTYQMSYRGKPVGQTIHSLKTTNSGYQLQQKTTAENLKIDADIKFLIEQKNLQPVSMNMTGSIGEPVDISLKWNNYKVSGHSFQARAGYKPQGKIEVKKQLKPLSVEQTSVLMLAHLFDLKPRQINTVEWYNSYDDTVKTIEISYLGDKKITVPAGTFETQMIQFLGGAPSQIYYISKEAKPKIIQIEVIASPWLYQLTDSKLL
jgi:broad specificity phosphatase PhoE